MKTYRMVFNHKERIHIIGFLLLGSHYLSAYHIGSSGKLGNEQQIKEKQQDSEKRCTLMNFHNQIDHPIDVYRHLNTRSTNTVIRPGATLRQRIVYEAKIDDAAHVPKILYSAKDSISQSSLLLQGKDWVQVEPGDCDASYVDVFVAAKKSKSSIASVMTNKPSSNQNMGLDATENHNIDNIHNIHNKRRSAHFHNTTHNHSIIDEENIMPTLEKIHGSKSITKFGGSKDYTNKNHKIPYTLNKVYNSLKNHHSLNLQSIKELLQEENVNGITSKKSSHSFDKQLNSEEHMQGSNVSENVQRSQPQMTKVMINDVPMVEEKPDDQGSIRRTINKKNIHKKVKNYRRDEILPATFLKVFHEGPILNELLKMWNKETEPADKNEIKNLCKMKSYGGNTLVDGCCTFPFLFKNQTISDCILEGKHQLWCSTTHNYDRDNTWAYCCRGSECDGS